MLSSLILFLSLAIHYASAYSLFMDYDVYQLRAVLSDGTIRIFPLQNLINSQRDVLFFVYFAEHTYQTPPL